MEFPKLKREILAADPAAVKDLADKIELDRVWKPQKRPLAGISRVEARVVPMGKDGRPRAFTIEFRKSLKKRSCK